MTSMDFPPSLWPRDLPQSRLLRVGMTSNCGWNGRWVQSVFGIFSIDKAMDSGSYYQCHSGWHLEYGMAQSPNLIIIGYGDQRNDKGDGDGVNIDNVPIERSSSRHIA